MTRTKAATPTRPTTAATVARVRRLATVAAGEEQDDAEQQHADQEQEVAAGPGEPWATIAVRSVDQPDDAVGNEQRAGGDTDSLHTSSLAKSCRETSPTRGRLRRLLVRGSDEAGLVRRDHRLDPVAQAELGQHVADVGLHRVLADRPARWRSRRWTGRARAARSVSRSRAVRTSSAAAGRGARPVAREVGDQATRHASARAATRRPPPRGPRGPGRPGGRPSAGTRSPRRSSASYT